MGGPAPATSFAAALLSGSAEALRAFPKSDLHCHSGCSASLQSIREWAGAPVGSPPRRMRSFDEMREWLLAELYPHTYHRQGFEFTAERSLREAIEDGVVLMEMSFDVRCIDFYETRDKGFFDFIRTLVDAHAGAIDFRPEIGVSKDRDPATQIAAARRCIDAGFFRSIDLYGNERAQPPEIYADLYRQAARRGLKRKAHAGEFGDAALVERTLQALDLEEIQHGVAAAASKPLMRLLKNEHIRLNVCPTSNVALSVAEDLAHHPIRALIENGVRVSINSDDKTVFGRSVSEEYAGLFQAGTATAEELEMIRIDSLLG